MTLDALGADRTKLTMRMIFPTAAARDYCVKTYGAVEGLTQTVERLGEKLAKTVTADEEFVIAHVLHAPREVVWRAWTEREQLMRWFGPKGFTMTTATLDFRPG